MKDYVKVPNSIVRDAIPNKFFKGMSKHTYDVLYQKTRGAIVPVRKIQITKNELIELTGFSDNTLLKHLSLLKQVGLIKITFNIGKHDGSIYEVFIPEEIETKSPNPPNPPNPPTQPQNMSPDPPHKMGWVGTVQTVETKEDKGSHKTFLKPIFNIDDDEKQILMDFINEFRNTSLKLTGKGLKISERGKWTEIAKLLVIELELAAARTDSVSSVPGFLREVLRRKIESKTTPIKKPGKNISKSLEVGKPLPNNPEPEVWEKENLSEEEKQKTLQIMRERNREGHRELIMSMQQIYTDADWQWLMEQLEKNA